MSEEKEYQNGYTDTSHEEINATQARRASMAEAAERRQSVALNIVENPLKVSIGLRENHSPWHSLLCLILTLFPSTAQLQRKSCRRCSSFLRGQGYA